MVGLGLLSAFASRPDVLPFWIKEDFLWPTLTLGTRISRHSVPYTNYVVFLFCEWRKLLTIINKIKTEPKENHCQFARQPWYQNSYWSHLQLLLLSFEMLSFSFDMWITHKFITAEQGEGKKEHNKKENPANKKIYIKL